MCLENVRTPVINLPKMSDSAIIIGFLLDKPTDDVVKLQFCPDNVAG